MVYSTRRFVLSIAFCYFVVVVFFFVCFFLGGGGGEFGGFFLVFGVFWGGGFCLFVFFLLFCFVFCFSVLLALRLPRLGRGGLVLVLFVRLFELRLFGFVCFLFILMSGGGGGGRVWWGRGAATFDCGTHWTFFLPFYIGFSVK